MSTRSVLVQPSPDASRDPSSLGDEMQIPCEARQGEPSPSCGHGRHIPAATHGRTPAAAQAATQCPFSCLPLSRSGSSCVPRQGTGTATQGHRPAAPGPGVTTAQPLLAQGRAQPSRVATASATAQGSSGSQSPAPGCAGSTAKGRGCCIPSLPPARQDPCACGAGPPCPSSGAPCKGHSDGRDGGIYSHGVHPALPTSTPDPSSAFRWRGDFTCPGKGGTLRCLAPSPGCKQPGRRHRFPFPLPAPWRLGGNSAGEWLRRARPGWPRLPQVRLAGDPGLQGAGVGWGLLLPTSRLGHQPRPQQGTRGHGSEHPSALGFAGGNSSHRTGLGRGGRGGRCP